MNLAAWLLFLIWCGFVLTLIMGWAIKSTFEQIQDIEMSEEDNHNVL